VLAGHDRDSLGLLVFPDLDACRALCGSGASGLAPGAVLADPRVRARFADLLGSLGRDSTGSSTRVERLILLEEPPSLDANEITDKGSLNARAILERRAALVDELFADTSAHTIRPILERT
jgi:feruloyl-CoA synthase